MSCLGWGSVECPGSFCPQHHLLRDLRAFPAALLSGGMSEAPFLFQSLSQASDEVSPPKELAPSNTTSSSSVNVAGASPPLLSVALGVAAALLLHLR